MTEANCFTPLRVKCRIPRKEGDQIVYPIVLFTGNECLAQELKDKATLSPEEEPRMGVSTATCFRIRSCGNCARGFGEKLPANISELQKVIPLTAERREFSRQVTRGTRNILLAIRALGNEQGK
jgi:hypothetical protein